MYSMLALRQRDAEHAHTAAARLAHTRLEIVAMDIVAMYSSLYGAAD
jgi:hypothetical protein